MQSLVLILIYLRIDLYFKKIDKKIKRLDVHTCITITIHTQPYKQDVKFFKRVIFRFLSNLRKFSGISTVTRSS